jgi:hypothetical protein
VRNVVVICPGQGRAKLHGQRFWRNESAARANRTPAARTAPMRAPSTVEPIMGRNILLFSLTLKLRVNDCEALFIPLYFAELVVRHFSNLLVTAVLANSGMRLARSC